MKVVLKVQMQECKVRITKAQSEETLQKFEAWEAYELKMKTIKDEATHQTSEALLEETGMMNRDGELTFLN